MTVDLPASKSISNRALIIHALSGGSTLPENLSDCDDTSVIIEALRTMPEEINIKAAGTAMRFMTAYLSVTPDTHILTGTERMKHRPIGILVDALRTLGANIEYIGEEGYPPLRITGLTLRLLDHIISRPYIDLTLWMMGEFGAEAEWTSADTITVNPKPYKSRDYFIENDWSGASYWYEILALNDDPESEIRLTGLMDGSKQGDSITRYIFSLLGVKTKLQSKKAGIPQTITLKKNGHCVPKLEYDFVNCPDLAQTFVVACAAMNIPFHFTGLSTLKIKETDRIEALKTEMRKLGYVVKDIDGSELLWDGERCEPSLEQGIDTYEDHRMALAFAPYAMKHNGLVINNPQVVTKSYPHYWDHLRQAGFKVE